jgi:hypothetical protein
MKKFSLIIIFIFLFFSLCFACNEYSLKKEFREWIFINWDQEITGGGICNGNTCSVDYWLIDLKNDKDKREMFINAYFSYYTTIGKLEKKWLNKPMPEGLKEFLKDCLGIYTP